MKEIVSHHDGHGLTESIRVVAEDEVGPGGAHHLYHFYVTTDDGDGIHLTETCVGSLQFQKGPRNVIGSTPGVLSVAVLAALADIQQDFQNGPFPSEEGEHVLSCLHEAMQWLRTRADQRAERGVLGFNKV